MRQLSLLISQIDNHNNNALFLGLVPCLVAVEGAGGKLK